MATTNNEDLIRRLGDTPDHSPEDTRSELLEKLDTKTLRRNEVDDFNQSPEDTRSELLDKKYSNTNTEKVTDASSDKLKSEDERIKKLSEIDAKQKSDLAAKRQADSDVAARKERERIQAAQGLNSFDMQKKKGNFKQDDLMLPISIKNAYTVVDGKYYAKDSNRIMFEDKGDKLVTSTTDKKTIADMVAHAKGGNNQWESIKLSGSQEFRREAWLQAESQGVKTAGYTPKEKDLVELENLTKERQKNSIVQTTEKPTEKAKDKEAQTISSVIAPRHDLNKNQAVLDAEAKKNTSANVAALQKSNSFTDQHSAADMNKLGYMRGLVMERDKFEPAHVQAESLARFDAQVKDNPNLSKSIDNMTEATVKDKTIERVQERNEPELSR